MELTLSRREQAQRLCQHAEDTYFTLAVLLSEIEESGEFKEWGFETFHEYAQEELQKSKGTISKLTKDGSWLRKHFGRDIPKLNTSYARLYSAINLLPEGTPEEVIAHATTLSESELIGAKSSKDAGEHACQAVCKHCKRLM